MYSIAINWYDNNKKKDDNRKKKDILNKSVNSMTFNTLFMP